MIKHWRRLHPAARALVVIAAVGLGVLLAGTALSRPTPRASAPIIHTGQPVPSTSPSASAPPSPEPTPISTPVAIATPAIPSGMDQATATAGGFLAAYDSYRWDDVDGLRAKLQPYVTDRFDASFEQGGGTGLGPGDHRIVTARVTDVTSSGQAPDGRLVMIGEVVETIRSDHENGQRTRYFDLRLAPTSAGWRVDEVSA